MRSKTVFLPVLCSIFLVFGEESGYYDDSQTEFLKDKISFGNKLYIGGSILTCVGLTGILIGLVSRDNVSGPAFSATGGTLFEIGLPMLGIGATKMKSAAKKISPSNFNEPSYGWFMYFGGEAFAVITAVTLMTMMDNPPQDFAPLMFPLITSLAGFGLELGAWYQFSETRDAVNMYISLANNRTFKNNEPVLSYWDGEKLEIGYKISF